MPPVLVSVPEPVRSKIHPPRSHVAVAAFAFASTVAKLSMKDGAVDGQVGDGDRSRLLTVAVSVGAVGGGRGDGAGCPVSGPVQLPDKFEPSQVKTVAWAIPPRLRAMVRTALALSIAVLANRGR